MLLKLFMSRKNTKIYFIIVLLISLLFTSISILNNYYIRKNNENFKGSYIFISDIENNNDYLKNIDIKEKIEVAKIEDGLGLFYKIDKNILDNNINVSKKIYDKIQNNEIYNNYKINICDTCYIDIITSNKYPSDNIINGYYIVLSDWSQLNDFIKRIDVNNNSIEVKYSEDYNENILIITRLLKRLIYIIKIFIIILYIVILIDLILDGKNKSSLLYTLGMNKYKIIKLVLLEFIVYLMEFLFISFIITIIYTKFML